MVEAHQPAPPARALVFAGEYRLDASRAQAPAGRVWIQLVNNGEDDHDLALRRADGSTVAATDVVHPHGVGELRAAVTPGRYVLVCTVADHEARGMRVTLRVKAPKGKRA